MTEARPDEVRSARVPSGSTHSVEEAELVLLRDVMRVLEDLEVPVWLDQGSLLGVVRDGGFLPRERDDDVDLGVWRKRFKHVFPEFARRLRAVGARVDFPPTSGTVMIRPSGDQSARPVNIGVYCARGDHVEKRAALIRRSLPAPCGPGKRLARRLYPWFMWRGRVLMKRGLGVRPGRTVQRMKYGVGSVLYQVGLDLRFRGHRQVVFTSPRSFFDSFERVEVYGMRFLIPKDKEGYLEHKYGEDWRVPREDWVFWEQDGAIAGRERGAP